MQYIEESIIDQVTDVEIKELRQQNKKSLEAIGPLKSMRSLETQIQKAKASRTMTSLRATPTLNKRLRWNFGSELKISKTLERSSGVRQSSTMNPYHASRQGGQTV